MALTLVHRRSDLAIRINAIKREIAQLEAQQFEEQCAHLLVTIASLVPRHVDFNARELFALQDQSPALADTFVALRVWNERSLGRRLQQIEKAGIDGAGLRLQRIGHDRGGVVWSLR
jgi:hypothetical protein